MSQTPEGIIKARETIRKKYGLTADGKSALHVWAGAKGGKAKVPKGFSKMTPEKRSEAGRRGGKVSRRSKSAN